MREGAAIKLMEKSGARLRTCFADGSLWLSDGAMIIRLSSADKIAHRRWYDGAIDIKLTEAIRYHLDTKYPLIWHLNGVIYNVKSLLMCGNATAALLDKFPTLFPRAEFRSFQQVTDGGEFIIYESGKLTAILPAYRLAVEEQDTADKISEMLNCRLWRTWEKQKRKPL
ncbi:MAG: hypothetical protein LBQ68_07970 [Clostridiales bacterium]|jgi:hypothetical protein|nr:hypothetical protein [Clostridiales bacterium]